MELDWHKYNQIANTFQYKAKPQDREDLKQEIILRLAIVASKNGHEPFTEGAMVRTASFVVKSYWRDIMRQPYMVSLNGDTETDDGYTTELWQTLADDKALDLEAWQDAKTWLLGCPRRLIEIAYKKLNGIILNNQEHQYLWRQRQKEYSKYQECLAKP